MADILLAQGRIGGFVYDEAFLNYGTGFSAPFVPELGKEYRITWDNEEFYCVSFEYTDGYNSAVIVGNLSLIGLGEKTNEPFLIGYIPDNNWIVIITSDEDESHDLALYLADTAVILKNCLGEDVIYRGVNSVLLTTTTGNKQIYSKGKFLDGVEIVLNFQNGSDQFVSLPDGFVTNSCVVIKPVNLLPEYIVEDVIIAGVKGTYRSPDVKYVTFKNGEAELFVKAVATGDDCVDIYAKGWIEKPTQESTVEEVFDYSGWTDEIGGEADSSVLFLVDEDKTVYAAFTSSVREYTATFYDGTEVVATEQVPYGSQATPPEITKDGYNFVGWVPSDMTITGDTDFAASWEVAGPTYVEILPEQYITTTYNSDLQYYGAEVILSEAITNNTTYIVMWNDATYTCVSRRVRFSSSSGASSSMFCLGNTGCMYKYIFGGTVTWGEDPTDEPFGIASLGTTAQNIGSKSPGTYKISIFKQV